METDVLSAIEPSTITLSQVSQTEDGREAEFRITELPRGFGHTIANGLRRTLLESISGAAPTNVRFDGAYSNFGTLDGVPEDLMEIRANLKGARFSVTPAAGDVVDIDYSPHRPGKVTAGDLPLPDGVVSSNPEHLLFTIDTSSSRPVHMGLRIRRGTGYVEAEKFKSNDLEDLTLDAQFSPVVACDARAEDERPGITKGETVIIRVRTDGTRTPEECVREAAALNQAQWARLAGDLSSVAALLPSPKTEAVAVKSARTQMPQTISELELPQRLENTLLRHGIGTVQELLEKKPDELLVFRNFGPRSFKELIDILEEKGYGEQVGPWRAHLRT